MREDWTMIDLTPTRFTRRDWLAGGAALAAGLAGSAMLGGQTLPAGAAIPSIGALARRKGLIYGAALDVAWMSDRGMLDALRTDCNMVGVANGFNWTRLQRNAGAPLDCTEAEKVYAFARDNGLLCRGHNLIWHDDSLPAWVPALVPTLGAARAGDFMAAHVRDVMTHFKGRMIQQDVVNEPIQSHGLQDTVWNRVIGERYIDLAFEAAKEADPGCLRILNQDWIEMDSPEHAKRRDQLLRLFERLLKRGVPVQALGIEGHLMGDFPFSERLWRNFLDEVTGMGLKLMVTEYDFLDHGIAGGIPERDAGVAALAHAFLTVTLSYPQCLGLNAQGYSDRYSWLFSTANKQRADRQTLRPDPLDDRYRRKPLWYAIADVIEHAAPR